MPPRTEQSCATLLQKNTETSLPFNLLIVLNLMCSVSSDICFDIFMGPVCLISEDLLAQIEYNTHNYVFIVV